MKCGRIQAYLFSSIGIVLVLTLYFLFQPSKQVVYVGKKWKGVSWVAGRSPLKGTELKTLKGVGVDAISQTPFAYQQDKNSPELHWEIQSEQKWWGESEVGITATLDSAATLGIISILKPHIWIRGSWPGEIQMSNETDWEKWFNNYTAFILEYAKLAEANQIPILCIGTELEMTSGRESDWRAMIRAIRRVYSGELTYAANFTEFEKVKFWGALDYIGIQAYFPLTTKEKADLKDLLNGWEPYLLRIDHLVSEYEKPVLFTELGYCNTEDAAVKPWLWPNERREAIPSEHMQALAYEAFFKTAWKKSWMAGVFFWKWYPELRGRAIDFTPQGKKAELVMTHYFNEELN